MKHCPDCRKFVWFSMLDHEGHCAVRHQRLLASLRAMRLEQEQANHANRLHIAPSYIRRRDTGARRSEGSGSSILPSDDYSGSAIFRAPEQHLRNFEPGGGSFGGAGASSTWSTDTASVADSSSSSTDSSPSATE